MSAKSKKIVMDLVHNRSKTFFVILSIFLGVFGVGLISNCYAITQREMNESYRNTTPASFVLRINPINQELLSSLEDFQGIESVEKRQMVRSRAKDANGNLLVTYLYVIDDFTNLKINTFSFEEGSHNPALGEILVEQASFGVLNASIGDNITVKIPFGKAENVKLAGKVHAPGLKPAWMERSVYGFISEETFQALGTTKEFAELRFRVTDSIHTQASIRTLAFSIKTWCETKGYQVDSIEIPTLNKHPNANQMNSVLFLFELFGVLSLILSGVLVINMISSLMSTQIRQIAILKSFGATTFQIASMYYIFVAILGIIALTFALPLASIAGMGLAALCADMLNYNLVSNSIPISSYTLQVGAGLLIPLLAATYPILKGCQISVYEGLNQGLTPQGKKKRLRIPFTYPHPPTSALFLLGLKNNLRRPGRLVLTLGTLTLGGAIFMIALNVNSSLKNTLSFASETLNYDAQYTLSKNYNELDILKSVENIPGIDTIETFSGGMASLLHDDGTSSNSFQLIAPPGDTKSMNLPLLEGRWLTKKDTNSIVLNHIFMDMEPDLKIGDSITLKSNGIESSWNVVGIVKEVGANERVYVNQTYYQKLFDTTNMARLLSIVNKNHAPAFAFTVNTKVEQQLEASNIDVMMSQSFEGVKTIFNNHLLLISGFLILASLLILSVGSLGLASTMRINITERSRELGVMRSLGASNPSIFGIILLEGLTISAISFLLSLLVSFFFSSAVGNKFGTIFLKTPLDNIIDPRGIFIWFVSISFITLLISIITCAKFLKLPVNTVLNYE